MAKQHLIDETQNLSCVAILRKQFDALDFKPDDTVYFVYEPQVVNGALTYKINLYKGDLLVCGGDGVPGLPGLPGKDGKPGKDGTAATIAVAGVETLEPYDPKDESTFPRVENLGTERDALLKFYIPRGVKGPKGDPGEGYTCAIRAVYPLAYGETPYTKTERIGDTLYYDFYVPQGPTGNPGTKGPDGDPGPRGPAGMASTSVYSDIISVEEVEYDLYPTINSVIDKFIEEDTLYGFFEILLTQKEGMVNPTKVFYSSHTYDENATVYMDKDYSSDNEELSITYDKPLLVRGCIYHRFVTVEHKKLITAEDTTE